MMLFEEWLSVTVISGLAIMSPGPGFAVVVRNSLSYGREAGITTALGNALGDMTHVILNVMGIGLLVANSPGAFSTVQWIGASYLLWLGVKGVLSKPRLDNSIEIENKTTNRLRAFCDGFLATLTNPKAFIFVFALFSIVVSTETPLYHKVVYGGWIGVLSACWFTVVAIFFTDTRFVKKFQGYRHWIERGTGLILIAFSVSLLLP
ncbi:MAG: LysE family transporter [Alphaproteobacteria bacterium]|nr:LysE family transporter [Alphaproteobacteria bacterium]